jgi:hypothetical protein
LFAFQKPPNVYEIYADPLKGQQVSLAWKQYMSAMAAAGVMRVGKQLDPRNAVASGSSAFRVRVWEVIKPYVSMRTCQAA